MVYLEKKTFYKVLACMGIVCIGVLGLWYLDSDVNRLVNYLVVTCLIIIGSVLCGYIIHHDTSIDYIIDNYNKNQDETVSNDIDFDDHPVVHDASSSIEATVTYKDETYVIGIFKDIAYHLDLDKNVELRYSKYTITKDMLNSKKFNTIRGFLWLMYRSILDNVDANDKLVHLPFTSQNVQVLNSILAKQNMTYNDFLKCKPGVRSDILLKLVNSKKFKVDVSIVVEHVTKLDDLLNQDKYLVISFEDNDEKVQFIKTKISELKDFDLSLKFI